MRMYSTTWRPERSRLVYFPQKQEACRDTLRQASGAGHGVLVLQGSSSDNGWNHCKNKFYKDEIFFNTQKKLACIYELTKNEGTAKNGNWNQCWTLQPNKGNRDKLRPNEGSREKIFDNLLAKEKSDRFEPMKTYELEMRTRPKETKKDDYTKDCLEQPSEITPDEEQIYCFEPKKIYELGMKTRPKKAKEDGYIKDCKEQPGKICDQCEKENAQPLRDTQKRMVRGYKASR